MRIGDPKGVPPIEGRFPIEKPKWYEDPGKVLEFAHWYFDKHDPAWLVIDYFEKPWKWNPEHRDYVEELAGSGPF